MKKNHLQLNQISEICIVIEYILDNILPNLIYLGAPVFNIRKTVIEEFKKHNISTIKDFIIDGFIVNDVCHISQGNQIVHGDGNGEIVKTGILKVDLVGYKNGLFGDAARSYLVFGESQEENKKMEHVVTTAKASFTNVLNLVKTGDYFYKISKTIFDVIKKNNCFVFEELTGHGIGEKLHEFPPVFNHYIDEMKNNEYLNFILEKGMVFAIEPLISLESAKILVIKDEIYHVPFTHDSEKDIYISHHENTIFFDDQKARLISLYKY